MLGGHLAIVCVREDHGLLDPCIANLRAVGFDHVVVACIEAFADQLSEVQACFATAGDVSFIPVRPPFDEANLLDLSGPYLGLVIERHRPEWLFMLDVDEFPVVRGGHLSELRGLAEADLLKVQRYNFARRRGETEAEILARLAAPARIPLIAERRDAALDLGTDSGPRWTFHRIAPRVMIRPTRFQRLEIGAHQVSRRQGADDAPRQIDSTEMCVVHLPFTSYARFEQKLRNIEAYLSHVDFMTGARAWHWKWWLRRFREGGLAEEYEREGLATDEYAALQASGGICTAEELIEAGDATPLPSGDNGTAM